MTAASVFTASGILSGLIQIALAVPMALRRVPPNGLYGFRTPKTLRGGSIWYDANAYAGKYIVVAGVLTVVLASAFGMFAPEALRRGFPLVVTGILIELGPLLTATAASVRRLARL